MKKLERSRLYTLWLYLFFGSFLLGVIAMNMGNDALLAEDGIFSVAAINRLKYIEIDNGRFLKYVLKHRMGEELFFVLLSTTGIGLASVYGCIVWQGILGGMTITAAIIRFGIKGLLLLLGGMFPHQLLLIPAEVMLLEWCYENCRGSRLIEKYAPPYAISRKQQFLRQGIMLLWISIVMLIGCILESYVNPILLSDLVKIF
ncbi:MAG: stage II sporulation protein M [Clostridium sp.]|nr:stage II sporulation protein M [Clostridium sp.]